MSILVCGGAGYIGSHCVRALKEAGYDCIIYDNLSEGHREAVKDFPLIVGDLKDEEKLNRVFAEYKIEGVIHFAAFALVGISMKEPLSYYENNVSAAISLLKAMERAKVKNIVFSSTCAVYGEPDKVPITEDMPTKPCNPYGQTKRDIEKLLYWCDEAYGIKSVCLRYFNAAGAVPDGSIGEDHALETHLLPLVFHALQGKREAVSVFGTDYDTQDGSCIRDYIHVLDLADAHIRALQYLIKGSPSNIFNLGTGTGTSVLEVIDTVKRITGKDFRVKLCERRPGDPAKLVAEAGKAYEHLGWKPQYSDMETIVKDAYAWHKNHPDGFGV